MQHQTNLVQKYFEKVPDQWDALYSHMNRWKYLLNRVLRKSLFERHEFAFRESGDLTGSIVLDVGCGSGRFSIESAKRGAAKVVGVDFASSMIEFSRRAAQEMDLSDKCKFIVDDVVSHCFDEKFDIVFAMGLFDYIECPEPLFKKISELAPKKFIASFPKYSLIWGMQRHVRYHWIRKCPIYYYSRSQIEHLYRHAGFHRVHIQEERTAFSVLGERLPSSCAN